LGRRVRGREELGVFLSKLTGAVESEVETGRFIDDEDGHVVQIEHTRGTVRETGARFEVPETHVWAVQEGKVKWFESYVDTAKMRAVLGLQPERSANSPWGSRLGSWLRPLG
jgi:hypothetical protein